MIMQPPKKKRRSTNVITPCWYYEKKELRNTPSIQDGIDFETECRYRKEGARFIIDTGMKMDLGYNTMATGVVYFHRFYMFHSFRNFPRYVTACCCLFLAGKVEETPKKCKDIIKTARTLLTDQKFLTFGEDPKEEVMTLERILLQTIKFDLQVEHPYSYLLKYAKCLKGDKTKLQKMLQMAWTFVNDSLCTTLCLQWEPEIIAVALMYLAGKLSKFEVVDWVGRTSKHLRWWDMFVEDVTMDLLEDICHQVLDLYSSQPQMSGADSPPPAPPPPPSAGPPTVHEPLVIAKTRQVSQIRPRERQRPISPASPTAPPPPVTTAKVTKGSTLDARLTPNGSGEVTIPGLGGPLPPEEPFRQYAPPPFAGGAGPPAASFPPTYSTPGAPPAAAFPPPSSAYRGASASSYPAAAGPDWGPGGYV